MDTTESCQDAKETQETQDDHCPSAQDRPLQTIIYRLLQESVHVQRPGWVDRRVPSNRKQAKQKRKREKEKRRKKEEENKELRRPDTRDKTDKVV